MKERAATAVLAGQANLVAFVEQRRIRERLGESPVERQLAAGHPPSVIDDALHLTMQRKTFGIRRQPLRELAQ